MRAENGKAYTIGIGLTDRCNANCPQCYSRPRDKFHDIDIGQVKELVEKVPISSINFGTGESILHPDFRQIIRWLSKRDISLSLTTNGSTVQALADEDLHLFHDIDFSLDFPTAELNDEWRGSGSYDAVMSGVERCGELGIEISFVACLMKENHQYMGPLARMSSDAGINLRVNVYKPVFTDVHKADYEQFWRAIGEMMDNAYLTACSEPIVNAAMGRMEGAGGGSPCGNHSLRIHPDGNIVPCVYLNESAISIDDFINRRDFSEKYLKSSLDLKLAETCRECEHKEICMGGCASRRMYNDVSQPDEYCFVVRNDQPKLNPRWKESKGLVHEDYLCTMIFSG